MALTTSFASARGKNFALRNSVFKIRNLHEKAPNKKFLDRNSQGQVNSATATAAHVPSFMYWLFHRGGISNEEATLLCAAKRLLLDGKPITDEAVLRQQMPWREMAELDFKVVNEKGVACDPVQRARHRTYVAMNLTKSLSFVPEEENPRSIIHSIPFLEPTSLKGHHVLVPAGFVDTMRGLVLVTNDAHLKPLWHNEFLGNWGRYDIRFHAGTPDDAISQLTAYCKKDVAGLSYSKDINVKPRVLTDHSIAKNGNDSIGKQVGTPLRSDVRLIIETPLFSFRLWSHIRRHIAICALVKNGPLSIPVETLKVPRRLTMDEMEELFAFERKLKTNKIVYGLRSLQDDDEGGEPLSQLSSQYTDARQDNSNVNSDIDV